MSTALDVTEGIFAVLYVSIMGLTRFYKMTVFTARRSYASAVLLVVILSVHLSVRPSVRLSHACFVTNPKNVPAIFFISYERAILLAFCHPTVVGGRRPLPPKMGDRSGPPLHKSLTSIDFRL